MIDTTRTDELRGERRFRLADGREIGVMSASMDGEQGLIEFASAAAGKSIQATLQTQPSSGSADHQTAKQPACLIDISHTGAKLFVPAKRFCEGPARLNLQAAHVDLKVALRVHIRWVERVDGKVARVGCEFTDPLPEHVIPRLAGAAFIERRQDRARESGLHANARQELADGKGVAVVVEDISQGGFRLVSDQPLKLAERLLLEVTDVDGQRGKIDANAQWQVADGEQFLVGCSYLTADAAERLKQLARTNKSVADVDGSDSRTRQKAADASDRDTVYAESSAPQSGNGDDSPSDHDDDLPQPDKSEIYPRQVDRITVITTTHRVEGLLHYMYETRLSDFMNSENTNNLRYLTLSDVEVTDLQSGQHVLRTDFMMLAHSQITCITPRDSICDK